MTLSGCAAFGTSESESSVASIAVGTTGDETSPDGTTAVTERPALAEAMPETSPPPAPPADAEGTPASTTEAPVYQEELVLSDSGLGGRPFGADPEDVITYVQSLLGSPTEDSGWVEAAEHPDCPGNQIRIVEWGVLSLQFSDASPLQANGQHFFGWNYGQTSEIGQSPAGLRTAEGISVGSSLGEVNAAYPGTQFSEGDPDTAFPDSWFVEGRYWGLLSGPADDDVTTRISSAFGCGD